jgi:hypothetical protein
MYSYCAVLFCRGKSGYYKMTDWNESGIPLYVERKDVNQMRMYIKKVVESEDEPTWRILDSGDIWPVTLGTDVDTDNWNIPENYIQPLVKIMKKLKNIGYDENRASYSFIFIDPQGNHDTLGGIHINNDIIRFVEFEDNGSLYVSNHLY